MLRRTEERARDALSHAVAGDNEKAWSFVKLIAEDEPHELAYVMVLWVDITIEACGLEKFRGQWVGATWLPEGEPVSPDTVITDGSKVDPTEEWAGLVFTARLSGRWDDLRVLVNSAGDAREASQSLYGVLSMSAAMMRTAAAGEDVFIFEMPDEG